MCLKESDPSTENCECRWFSGSVVIGPGGIAGFIIAGVAVLLLGALRALAVPLFLCPRGAPMGLTLKFVGLSSLGMHGTR